MISILSTSYMRIKHRLFVVSFLFSLPVLSQETDSISHTYPILGYYRLGMTEEEFLSQMYKMQSETGLQDSISFQTQYLIDVNGINFDMDGGPASSCLDISATTCSLYKPDATPLYFAGGTYFLDGKLVSFTANASSSIGWDAALCYMRVESSLQESPYPTKAMYDIHNVEHHNSLVKQSNDLTAYLSKKYGAPTKENKLNLLPPLKEDEYVRTFGEWWYLTCDVGAILSRAEWKQGNMKIVTGITSSGRTFISFLDEKALSHANLDEYFKQAEPTKAKVAW